MRQGAQICFISLNPLSPVTLSAGILIEARGPVKGATIVIFSHTPGWYDNMILATARWTKLVQITDMARDKINELLDENSGKYLRIYFEGGG